MPAPSTREHPAAVVKLCKSCKALVIWLYTAKGKAVPVDADTVAVGYTDQQFAPYMPGLLGHRSHFASCPDAARWRR